MSLRQHQVQKLYLEIQANLGQLINEASPEEQKMLRKVSIELVQVKRHMIGFFDEIDQDNLPR